MIAAHGHIAEDRRLGRLVSRQRIVDEVRLSLPTAGALVDQCLNGGHRG